MFKHSIMYSASYSVQSIFEEVIKVFYTNNLLDKLTAIFFIFFYFLFFYLFIFFIIHYAVITPPSYTARLGNAGTFHCAVMGEDVISWYVNGSLSTYAVIQNRQISTAARTPINATWSQSSLTVYASQENDGLSIYCVAVVLGGPDEFSKIATFSHACTGIFFTSNKPNT